MDSPGGFKDNSNVLPLNPTLVKMETLETQSLLDRARGGDTDAFCELSRIHATRLLRQAVTLCGNASRAEELAQDTLVESWKGLHRYTGRCQFFTWLCAILLNRHRNSIRQQRTMAGAAFTAAHADEDQDRIARLSDHDPLPDEAVQQREQAVLVQQCIQLLPRKHQQVIYLRFYVDDSLEGIAAALGCSVGTVKSRLFHALEKLRSMNALRALPYHPQEKAGRL
jgi:RNA polymerase sigma-70 factor, ECF subfamily